MGTSTIQVSHGTVSVPANFCGNHFASSLPVSGQYKTWVSHDAGCAWYQINTAAGVYNWTRLDACVASLGSNDWTYTVVFTPPWASTNTSDGMAGRASKPSSWAYLSDFVTALCTRYPTLARIEVWNEPDIVGGASFYWTNTVADFVTLCQTINVAAKAVRPGIEIIGPGCVNYLSSPNWLNAFYAAGGAAYLDAISTHCYQMQYGTEHKALLGVFHALSYNLKARSDNGVTLPLKYCTEFGQINPLPSTETDAVLIAGYKRAMTVAAGFGFQSASWYIYDGATFGYSTRPAVVQAVADFVALLCGSTLSNVVLNMPEMTVSATINGTPYTF